MGKTKIEWTDATWNPTRGCSLVSEGCRNCYAMKFAHRFSGEGGRYEGLTELGPTGPRWNGTVRTVPEQLRTPLHWRKPRRVFVDSMSDLFHEGIDFEYIAAVFGVMAATPRHTYQILTKRPERMVRWFEWVGAQPCVVVDCADDYGVRLAMDDVLFPLPNAWLGVSVEDQKTADERIPKLLQVPAAVRFVSAEPLLGPVDLEQVGDYNDRGLFDVLRGRMRGCSIWDHGKLGWVIVGGESGSGARPMQLKWARDIVRQCSRAGVACFVKQLGKDPRHDHTDEDHTAPGISAGGRLFLKSSKGGDPSEWPEDLRVREFPEATQ